MDRVSDVYNHNLVGHVQINLDDNEFCSELTVGEEQQNGGRQVPFRLTPNLQHLLGPLILPGSSCTQPADELCSEGSGAGLAAAGGVSFMDLDSARDDSFTAASAHSQSQSQSHAERQSVSSNASPLVASMVAVARALRPRGPLLSHYALGSGTGASFLASLRLLLTDELLHYYRKVCFSLDFCFLFCYC